MTPFFSYAACFAILAMVLAVARNVPILHVLAIPDCDVPPVTTSALSLGWLVAMLVGWGPSSPKVTTYCQALVWLGALSSGGGRVASEGAAVAAKFDMAERSL
jgi:hypothetical protein